MGKRIPEVNGLSASVEALRSIYKKCGEIKEVDVEPMGVQWALGLLT